MIVVRDPESLFDLFRLLLAATVLLAGLLVLRRLRGRVRPDSALPPIQKTLDHDLGDSVAFVPPSLVMSFFCLASWWDLSGYKAFAAWLFLLALPAAALVGSTRLLIRLALLPSRPVLFMIGSASSLAALIGGAVFLALHPESVLGSAISQNPSSPGDTLRSVALILFTGISAFALPGVLWTQARSGFRWRRP